MDIDGIVSQLRAERDRISSAIAALEGAVSPRPQAQIQQKRGMSPLHRKRLSEAAKRRWAERRKATSTGTSSSQASTQKKRGGLTPAGRKRLSELMKKRWAERRKKGA